MVCRKKLVIVGDGTCGKTCLLIVFSKDQFPEVGSVVVNDKLTINVSSKPSSQLAVDVELIIEFIYLGPEVGGVVPIAGVGSPVL